MGCLPEFDPARQLAFVSTGPAGLAIADVTQFDKPIILSQTSLPNGTATSAVANATVAVVADNAGGVVFLDISDPTKPVVRNKVPLPASQVVTNNGVVYALSSFGSLASFDINTATLLQSKTVTRHLPTGVARDGTSLYVLDDGGILTVIDLPTPTPTVRGSITVPYAGKTIFVGNGLTYVAARTHGTLGGFSVIDVSNADAPKLIGVPNPVSAITDPGTVVAANGSGKAVLLGTRNGIANAELDVMNLTDPTDSTALVTALPLPAQPADLVLSYGLALIAGGTAGLQVVNYLPSDNLGPPPTGGIDPTNWSTGKVPGLTDNVDIELNSAVIDHRKDASVIQSLTTSNPRTISGGSARWSRVSTGNGSNTGHRAKRAPGDPGISGARRQARPTGRVRSSGRPGAIRRPAAARRPQSRRRVRPGPAR